MPSDNRLTNGFNPIKETVDGKKAHSVIWSTKTLNLALDGLGQGRKLIANPFYENNTKILKGDLVFQRTPEEEAEFLKCMNDIVYFANTYCKLMTPEGIKNVEMRDYQIEYLKHLTNHQLSILLAARQIGKTTTSAIFMLHYILFNTDKNSLVLGSTRQVAVEILDKLKKIFYEIPYFLKPGVYKWNESEIALDNGCRCMAQATTVNSGISFTFHCVLADEFAHIAPNILDKFYNQIFPTIIAGKAKFIISSTQNGFNLFQKLYTAAEDGENDYAPFRVDWWQVPEWNPDTRSWDRRDEVWHRRQAANLGGEDAFQAQFGTKFMVQADSLIDQRILTDKLSESKPFENKYLPGVSASEYYVWKPDFEPAEDLKRNRIVVTIDIAEGIGKDSTVFVFNRIIDTETTETVGMFVSNKLSIQLTANSLCEVVNLFCNYDYTLLSVELNTYGDLFVRYITENIEKQIAKFDESIILKYPVKDSKQYRNGVKMTSATKPMYCTLFKQRFESNQVRNNSTQFLRQAENFADVKGNGSYEAIVGHDDIMMAQVQIVAAQETPRYRYLAEESIQDQTNVLYDFYTFDNPWMTETYNRMQQSQTQMDIYSGFSQIPESGFENRLRRF